MHATALTHHHHSLFRDERVDDAERRLRELIQEQPRFSAAHIAMAERMRSRGNIEEATTILRKRGLAQAAKRAGRNRVVVHGSSPGTGAETGVQEPA